MSNVIHLSDHFKQNFNKIFEVRTCLECGSRCKLDHADPFEDAMSMYQCTECGAFFRRYDFERAK